MGNYSSQFYNDNYKIHTRSKSEPSLFTSNENIQNGYNFQNEKVGYCSTSVDELETTPTTIQNSAEKGITSVNNTSNCLALDDNVTFNDLCKFDPRSPNLWCPRTPILVQQSLLRETGLKKSTILEHQVAKNDIDPRSPAESFARTPILKLKTTKLARCNLKKDLVNNSNSDSETYVKLSYCETTSLFNNVPEIQAQPDITYLENSGILEKKLNLTLIPTVDTNNKKSNTCENFTMLESPLSDNNFISDNKPHHRIDKTFEENGPHMNSEEKFVIWQDQIKHSDDKLKTTKSTDLEIGSKLFSKEQDILSKSNGISSNANNDLLNDGKTENMQDCKNVNIKLKHRTPLSNRLNNRQFQTITPTADQSFIKQSWNKDVKIKNCQENTPPMKMKKTLQLSFH